MMRKYIKLVEAATKGCPVATYDLDTNLKNRQKAKLRLAAQDRASVGNGRATLDITQFFIGIKS